MKTLIIKDGFMIPTEWGFRRVIGKHYEDFAVDDYEVDEDGNETKVGEAIIRRSEIKSAMHEATGESYDLCIYDWSN